MGLIIPYFYYFLPMINRFKKNILLKPYTSFKVGGPAKYFCEVESCEDLPEIYFFAQQNDLPIFILGKGSNLVISDDGWNGLVIVFGKKYSKNHVSGNIINSNAGASFNAIAQLAVNSGLGGMEKMSGIPGTLGGAVRMNAGAFGQETCEIIKSVKSYNPATNSFVIRNAAQCEFSYRHSIYCENSEVICDISLQLTPLDFNILNSTKTDILKKRKSKQPLELPNAGSMFKRPPGNYAGTLIEASGLKGYTIGGAQVSEKHANFLVNIGDASAQDIYNLSQKIIDVVEKDSGITLEREVIFLGTFR